MSHIRSSLDGSRNWTNVFHFLPPNTKLLWKSRQWQHVFFLYPLFGRKKRGGVVKVLKQRTWTPIKGENHRSVTGERLCLEASSANATPWSTFYVSCMFSAVLASWVRCLSMTALVHPILKSLILSPCCPKSLGCSRLDTYPKIRHYICQGCEEEALLWAQ